MNAHQSSLATITSIPRVGVFGATRLAQILALVALSLSITSGHCGSAKISNQREISASPTNKPTMIYVADFDLDAADIKAEKGLLPPPPKLPGPLGNALPPPPGTPKDPQKLARELVGEMSESLVRELTKAGLNARRLTSTNALPASGWLVRGVFTEVNQGNQLERAVIGFGKGRLICKSSWTLPISRTVRPRISTS